MLSQRLTIKLHCSMDFKTFPFDSQICDLGLESYANGFFNGIVIDILCMKPAASLKNLAQLTGRIKFG